MQVLVFFSNYYYIFFVIDIPSAHESASVSQVDMKVVLLGQEYGGKTSLVERFMYNRFNGVGIPYQAVSKSLKTKQK